MLAGICIFAGMILIGYLFGRVLASGVGLTVVFGKEYIYLENSALERFLQRWTEPVKRARRQVVLLDGEAFFSLSKAQLRAQLTNAELAIVKHCMELSTTKICIVRNNALAERAHGIHQAHREISEFYGSHPSPPEESSRFKDDGFFIP